MKCVFTARAQTDNPSECVAASKDYTECLHHTQEIARARAVKTHFIEKAAHQAKEGRKTADILSEGVIVGVGLIGGSQKEEAK